MLFASVRSWKTLLRPPPRKTLLRLNVVEATEVQPQSVSNAWEPQGIGDREMFNEM